MKTFQVIAFITIGLAPLSSTFAQDSVAVEGKVIATTNKGPIGAFTVKAYPPESVSGNGCARLDSEQAYSPDAYAR